MKYYDLRDFIKQLEHKQLLQRVTVEVDPALEMTEISDRMLRAQGAALLFENPKGFEQPVLANLFGTPERVAMGMGRNAVSELRELGQLLAYLKEPTPPKGLVDAAKQIPLLRQVLAMSPKVTKRAPCQANIIEDSDVDLTTLPIQTCWPGDAGPLITWGLVTTLNVPFQHQLGCCGHEQFRANTFDEFCFGAAQQSGERIL